MEAKFAGELDAALAPFLTEPGRRRHIAKRVAENLVHPELSSTQIAARDVALLWVAMSYVARQCDGNPDPGLLKGYERRLCASLNALAASLGVGGRTP